MRAFFSVVALLAVLAVVGVVATKQLKALSPSAQPAASASKEGSANLPVGGAQSVQRQIQVDLNQAIEHGASRVEEAAP